MADEPAVPVSRVSDAHDDNGGSREPPCDSPIDDHGDATPSGNRKVMEAHDADLEKASRGLEPSRASVLADELHPAASPGALPERQLSSVAREVVSMSGGVAHGMSAHGRICGGARHGGGHQGTASTAAIVDAFGRRLDGGGTAFGLNGRACRTLGRRPGAHRLAHNGGKGVGVEKRAGGAGHLATLGVAKCPSLRSQPGAKPLRIRFEKGTRPRSPSAWVSGATLLRQLAVPRRQLHWS